MSFMKAGLAFAIALASITAVEGAKAQSAAAESWQVEIDIYSGRRNPVFTLTAAELADVQTRVSAAKPLPATAAVNRVRPTILGYRGLIIRGRSADGKQVVADIEVSRGKILHRRSAAAAVVLEDSAGLERALVSLGEAKKLLSAEDMAEINKTLR